MELKIGSIQGIPTNSRLSVKVGDNTRQGPASKIGHIFAFASSLAEPLPLQAELWAPIAPFQTIPISPSADHVDIDFGSGMSITLNHREDQTLHRASPEIGEVAKSRGLPAEKLAMAQTAAKYLEDHDLVRTFQDILHGLLISKPANPFDYIDEHFARARALAARKRGDTVETKLPSNQGEVQKPQRDHRQDHVESIRAVKLRSMLEGNRARLQEVITFLPKHVVDQIRGQQFNEVCEQSFTKLDANANGILEPSELFPTVERLCQVHHMQLNKDECIRLISLFDHDRNGVISVDEFSDFVKFVVAMGFLDNPKEHHKIVAARGHVNVYDLLVSIKVSPTKIDEIFKLLPQHMQVMLMSDKFTEKCSADFRSLIQDGGGFFDVKTSIPAVCSMAEVEDIPLTREECERSMAFGNGRAPSDAITQKEYIELVRFTLVVAYLETDNGQTVADNAEILLGEKRIEELLHMLERDKHTLRKVILKIQPLLPRELFEKISSSDFVSRCEDRFADLDKKKSGVLSISELFPVVVKLSEAHPFSIDEAQCERFVELFDIREDGGIHLDEFMEFAQFYGIMSYLESEDGKEQLQEALDIIKEGQQVEELLLMLQKDPSKIQKVISHLPESLQTELSSANFELRCTNQYEDVDEEERDEVEPEDLYPLLTDLAKSRNMVADLQDYRRFSRLFEDDAAGTVSCAEYVKFARFVLVTGYLQTEAGQEVVKLLAPVNKSSDGISLVGIFDETGQTSLNFPTSPLAVDVDYIKAKSEKLETDNAALREQMKMLQNTVRLLEGRVEAQDQRMQRTV